jgi:hypothetical protein
MTLRDFLLDYAEKAPKARRLAVPHLRFEGDVCPLELAHGCPVDEAWNHYFPHDGDIASDIIVAADVEEPRTERMRTWRAVLEKLAEP